MAILPLVTLALSAFFALVSSITDGPFVAISVALVLLTIWSLGLLLARMAVNRQRLIISIVILLSATLFLLPLVLACLSSIGSSVNPADSISDANEQINSLGIIKLWMSAGIFLSMSSIAALLTASPDSQQLPWAKVITIIALLLDVVVALMFLSLVFKLGLPADQALPKLVPALVLFTSIAGVGRIITRTRKPGGINMTISASEGRALEEQAAQQPVQQPRNDQNAARMADGSPSPNWYPDPSGQARLRWWDGQRWTEKTAN